MNYFHKLESGLTYTTWTTNPSFLKVCEKITFGDSNIQYQMMALNNPDLIGIDPKVKYNEYKDAIDKEISENYWYWLRECVSIRNGYLNTNYDVKFTPFILRVVRYLELYLIRNGYSVLVNGGRQDGKTMTGLLSSFLNSNNDICEHYNLSDDSLKHLKDVLKHIYICGTPWDKPYDWFPCSVGGVIKYIDPGIPNRFLHSEKITDTTEIISTVFTHGSDFTQTINKELSQVADKITIITTDTIIRGLPLDKDKIYVVVNN